MKYFFCLIIFMMFFFFGYFSCKNKEITKIPYGYGRPLGIWKYFEKQITITNQNNLLIYNGSKWQVTKNDLILEYDYYYSISDKKQYSNKWFKSEKWIKEKYITLKTARKDLVEIFYIGKDKNLYIGTGIDFENGKMSKFKRIG